MYPDLTGTDTWNWHWPVYGGCNTATVNCTPPLQETITTAPPLLYLVTTRYRVSPAFHPLLARLCLPPVNLAFLPPLVGVMSWWVVHWKVWCFNCAGAEFENYFSPFWRTAQCSASKWKLLHVSCVAMGSPKSQQITLQYWTIQHITAQFCTALHCTALHNTTHHITTQQVTAHHSTVKHSTAQHRRAQHSRAQHSPVHYKHITANNSTSHHSNTNHSKAHHSTTLHIKAQYVT